MPKLTAKAADLRDPADSRMITVKIECALDCDGSICRGLAFDGLGEPVEAAPHFHLIEGGRNPEASPRHHFMQFA